MRILEAIGVIKDIVLLLAACVGSYVALRGLSTWQRQLKGNAEFEVGRRIRRSAYQIREGIRAFRSALILPGESIQAMKEAGLTEEQIAKIDINLIDGYAYSTRWRRISDAMTELSLAALEGEAIWGAEIQRPVERLGACAAKLYANTTVYFQLRSQGCRTTYQIYADMLATHEQYVYRKSENDEYEAEVLSAVSEIDAYIKSKLET
jgi:hypothetical protein